MKTENYVRELDRQLTYLMAFTRHIGELDMVGALFGEFRGEQSAGWSTEITAYEVFNEFQALATKGSPLSISELRQVLCLYAQLSEAGGVYEGLLNLIGVVQLKPWSMWPFKDMVRVRQNPKRVIGPNANVMFRRLAQAASDIGMIGLSELLEETFSDNLRNGIVHADYILGSKELRLRRRNGGPVMAIPYGDLVPILSNGLAFFELLDGHRSEARRTFRPGREIIGRFSANPPMRCRVELAEDGRFSLTMAGIARESDTAYERQERINAKLGGRVFMGYSVAPATRHDALIGKIAVQGFNVPVVVFDDSSQFDLLLTDATTHGLWRSDIAPGYRDGSLLLATPAGFVSVDDIDMFEALLPPWTWEETNIEAQSKAETI